MFGSFFRRDPTQSFKRTAPLPLSWDTERQTMSGIRLGGEIGTLAPLGPASHHESNGKGWHNIEYADLGLTIVISEGLTDSALFTMSQIEELTKSANFKAASIRVKPQGITISPSTREDDVLRAFGTPRERDADEEMISLQYDIGTFVYEFDFTGDGTLTTFAVYAD